MSVPDAGTKHNWNNKFFSHVFTSRNGFVGCHNSIACLKKVITSAVNQLKNVIVLITLIGSDYLQLITILKY